MIETRRADARRGMVAWTVTSLSLVLFALLLVSVSGCAPSGGDEAGTTGGGAASVPETLTVTEADAGSTKELVKGQGLAVELEGNPTTGYDWVVEGSLPPVLGQVAANEFDPESTALGAPGMVRLDFEAIAEGEGQLTLGYLRPFEKGQAPTKTFAIQLSVREP